MGSLGQEPDYTPAIFYIFAQYVPSTETKAAAYAFSLKAVLQIVLAWLSVQPSLPILSTNGIKC